MRPSGRLSSSDRKIVHVSILHPSESSPYPYFRGKAIVERALAESGLRHASLRPSVLFRSEERPRLDTPSFGVLPLPLFPGKGDSRTGTGRVRLTSCVPPAVCPVQIGRASTSRYSILRSPPLTPISGERR